MVNVFKGSRVLKVLEVSRTFSYKIKLVMFYNWLPILCTEYHVRIFPGIHSAMHGKVL